MEEPTYVSIGFGRKKEYYFLLLKNEATISFEGILKDFNDSVAGELENPVGIPGNNSADKISDFKLVGLGTAGMIKKGYQFVNLWNHWYMEDPEYFSGTVGVLGESHFKSHTPEGSRENLCLVGICQGMNLDEFEAAVFRPAGSKEKFTRDCNGIHPLTDPVEDTERMDFINRISEQLSLLGYAPVEFHRLNLECSHSKASAYWEDIAGATLFRRLNP